MLRPYELMVVIAPDAKEEQIAGVMDRVSRQIAEKGGSVESQDLWGRRRLAYPIKRHFEGTYILSRLQMAPESAADLDAQLRINEQVLRHLLIRQDD